ncbi:MAG: DUF305 domain-containing protein [Niameybacter sp.]|uniref:DUF305 domain-containing protein n=1 Tax=Niameybacter sp. TaxID=2033640 RepID=UPI002FC7DF9D
MKRLILQSYMVVCLCLMLVSSLQAQERPPENPGAYKKQQTVILKTMRKDMDKSSDEEDATLDYVEQMLAYYKAGSALAQNVMDHGDNQIIRQVGRSMRKRNAEEMKKMEELRIKLKEQKVEDDLKEAEYLVVFKETLETMMEDLQKVEDENVDRIFLLQMICYNEGIIKMAQNILKYTPNVEVQEIAQKIIERHTKEIPYLQKLAREIRI